MTQASVIVAINHLALRLLPILITSCLKASVFFACVYGVTRLLKNVHPRLRHLLWLSAISSYLLILLLSLFNPVFHFGRIRIPFERAEIYDILSSPFLPKEGALPIINAQGQTGANGNQVPAVTPGGFPLWALTSLLLWIAGAFASYLKIVAGRIRLIRLDAKADLQGSRRHQRLMRQLTSKMGIKRRVQLVKCAKMTVPFTCRIVKPIVVLPSSMNRWPDERLRAVLLHELRHIKRMDSLTQSAARVICSLFWYVPFMWTAYSNLYLEQEKACDMGAIGDGVERCAYAECVLDAVRLSHQTALFAGLLFSGGRKRILEERIHHILKGGNTMKKGRLIFIFTVLAACALIVLSGAAGKKSVPNEEAWKKFVGEWVNTETLGTIEYPQKIVIKPDYTGEDWKVTTNTSPNFEWQVEIQKCWTEGKGNTYCQFFKRYINIKEWMGIHGNTFLCLMRMDKSNTVLEMNARDAEVYSEYPEKIDPKVKRISEGDYFIFHRK